MAKINVILKCQLDSGKEKKLPGETVSLDEKEARKLAGMGMVEMVAAKPSRAKKNGGVSPSPEPDEHGASDDDNPDADGDGEGGEDDV